MTNIQPDCFHCGLPVPPDSNFIVEVLDRPWAMCCRGCQAVAQAIVDAGLQAYYRHRTQNAHQAPNLDQPMPGLEAFDHPAVQKSFVKESDGSHQEVALLLNGTTCAACVWLNEQRLSALPGVLEVDANYMTQCLRVRWDITRLKLSAILRAVRELGYDAQPYHKARGRQAIDGERDTLLRRIGVAGVFGMQVMMLSAALYFGDWSGIDDRHRELLQRVALLLTVPVIAYSAQPFFVGAVNG
ncbi:MAG: heavy metal translocating P-type ATPase metal-binding domain-containing protein, partial [Gammaproteobacteria bacterium]|nr:heavy metal translocating P-type ATPase metal-binding domain-containing protein [Gammaproteobacteria bacterium]